MRGLLLITGLGLALAGCKSEPSVSLTNASPEEAAAKAKAAGLVSQIRAGQWETKVELVELDMPGMDPALKAEMLKQGKGAKVHSYCVTEEEAKKPGGIFADDSGKCTYSKFDMAGGKVDITMSCPGGGAGGMTMHVAGKFSADEVAATSEMQTGGQMAMKMKANVTSRRTGDCKAGAPAK